MKVNGLIIFLFLLPFSGLGQIRLNGRVLDSLTREPIPFSKVRMKVQNSATVSSAEGEYEIHSSYPIDTVLVDFIGYKQAVISVSENTVSPLNILLRENVASLDEVVITAGENPVFEILRKIKEKKTQNNPEKLEAYECKVYNKMQFSVNNMGDKFEERRAYRKFDFIMDYVDNLNGEKYLPVLLSESISDYYFRSNPTQRKEVIEATRITGIDNLELGQFTGDMYQNVNIYDDYLELFNKEFLSPIANEGKLFYKYYLMESDILDGIPCYHIQFKPKRKGGALFQGDFWVTADSYAVKRVVAEIPNDVNLNYVSDFYVEQNYKQVDDSVYVLANENMTANFDLFSEQEDSPLIGVTVNKSVNRSDFILNDVKPFNFYVSDIVILDSADQREDTYWQETRPVALSDEEAGVIEMVDSLKANKTYRFYENLAYMSYTGFWRTGPIETGSIYSIYNQNVVEGNRFMLSMRTSNKFSKKVEISAFTAYGTLDREWKYGGSIRWKLRESPREMLRFAYRKRIDQLGLIASVGDVGNSFSTLLSAAPLDKLTMVNQASVGLEKDWRFDIRTFNNVEWKNYIPLGQSDYSQIDPTSGDTNQVSSLTSFQIRNQIMFTKEEKFLKGQFDRISLGSKYPIISLTHAWGVNEILGSEYGFHRLDFIWNHRPRLGMFGRLNYTIHAGKIFGTVPYPFLQVHQGNETYYYQVNNFNLMNYYEFISDQWVRILFEHHLQGAIMDRIPLINKLKLRLVYTGKMVIGSYSDAHNKEMLLPFYSNRITRPYYEVSVGLENILKFIRVDAIWRLSYRNNLDLNDNPIPNFGIKFVFTSDF
jgi:hypothetical protein